MSDLELYSVWAFLLLILSRKCFSTAEAIPVEITIKAKYTAEQIPASPIFFFPDGKQAENMIVRSSGNVLVTLDTSPDLYQINPFLNQTGGIAHRFEGYTSLFGIVEEKTDVFYVIASNFSGPPDYEGYGGSVSIFEVDLRNVPDPTISQGAVKASKIVNVPEAQLLDGLTIVDQRRGLLMSGDAQTGTLYLIDTHKHTEDAVLQEELLMGTSEAVAAGLAHIGVNGLKFHNGTLYFTNTAKGLYG